jgi:hypothetical protein
MPGNARGGDFRAASEAAPLMVETNDLDDVGAAFDRARVTDLAIPNGFGQPDNDRRFSFYVASPQASRSKSATAPGRSARTGTTAAATTASAPGATSRSARSQPQDHRREARQHQREPPSSSGRDRRHRQAVQPPVRPRAHDDDVARTPVGVGACHNQPTRRKFQRSRRTATTMIRIASG